MELKIGDPIFQTWKVKKVIAKGSFATVYEIVRNEFGHVCHAVAKVIEVSKNQFYSGDVMENNSQINDTEYYSSLVENVVEECSLIERMRRDSHIVSYEDHQVECHHDGSWIIYIRMELLKPLSSYFFNKEFSNQDVIQLGIDLCMGLESCQEFNITHRDIQPENIFVTETGMFKLGGFGISRILSTSEMMISNKGTQLYMAPEVYRREPYSPATDIYSLGLILYRLTNNNRLPFLPPFPESIHYQDNETALRKRLSGLAIPTPCNAAQELGDIIQKACEFDPSKRYSSPNEMRKDLEAIRDDFTKHENINLNQADRDKQNVSVTIQSPNSIEELTEDAVEIFQYQDTKVQEPEDDQAENVSVIKEEIQAKENQQQNEWQKNIVNNDTVRKTIVQSESNEEDVQSENEKLIEQAKRDLEIKSRTLKQQRVTQHESEDEEREIQRIMRSQFEERRQQEEKERRDRNITTFVIIFIPILFIMIINLLI